MAKPNWLSIEEIARLWGEEKQLDASAIRQDLEKWFAEFVEQPAAALSCATDKNTDNTNRLMGVLGSRYLEKRTFEIYCKDRGKSMPCFWFDEPVDETQGAISSRSEITTFSLEPTPEKPSTVLNGNENVQDFGIVQTELTVPVVRSTASSVDALGSGKISTSDLKRNNDDPRPTIAPAERTPQELLEEATEWDTAERKSQNEAAHDRSGHHNVETSARQVPSVTWSSAPSRESPERLADDPVTGTSGDRENAAWYENPSVINEFLSSATDRWNARRGMALLAGLFVFSLGLMLWGGEQEVQQVSAKPDPTPKEAIDPMAGTSSVDKEQSHFSTSTSTTTAVNQTLSNDAVASPEPIRRRLDAKSDDSRQASMSQVSGTVGSLVVEDSFVAGERQFVPLKAAYETSSGATDPLHDEPAVFPHETQKARDLRLASNAALTAAATASRQLAVARAQISELTRARDVAADEVTDLRVALRQAADQKVQAERAQAAAESAAAKARVSLASAKQELALLAERLESAISGEEDTRAQMARLSSENARLAGQLAESKADVSSLRTALQEATHRAEGERRDLAQALNVSSAELATLRKKLQTAREQIAVPNKLVEVAETASGSVDEDTKLKQGQTTEFELPTIQSAAIIDLDQVSGADAGPSQRRGSNQFDGVASGHDAAGLPSQELAFVQNDIRDTQGIGDKTAEPAMDTAGQRIDEAPTGSEAPATRPTNHKAPNGWQIVPTPKPKNDVKKDVPEQVAAIDAAEVMRDAEELRDTVSADDLVFDPKSHIGRQVVVTGSVVRLLWRYRLISESGQNSIVLDVDGLHRSDRAKLEEAIEKAGFLGQVRARINGRIERQSVVTFNLAASELVLLEGAERPAL